MWTGALWCRMKWGEGNGNQDIVRNLMAMQQDIAGLRSDMKAAFRRIDEQTKLTETVHKLATSVEFMAKEQARMSEEQERQRADIEELRLKPAKRWDSAVAQVIALVIAAVAGGLLSRVMGG